MSYFIRPVSRVKCVSNLDYVSVFTASTASIKINIPAGDRMIRKGKGKQEYF